MNEPTRSLWKSAGSHRWRSWIVLAVKLLGVVLFILLFRTINKKDFLSVLHTVSPQIILLCAALLLAIQTLKCLRWQYFARYLGVEVPFWETWKTYHISIFLGLATPGRIGELIRVEHLHVKNVARLMGLSIVIIERAFDLFTVCALAALGTGYLFGMRWGIVCDIAFLGLLTLSAITISISHRFESLRKLTTLFTPQLMIGIALTTIVIWALSLLWALLISRAIGIMAPAEAVMSAFAISCLFAILPITFAGLGTRDAAILLLLHPYNVAPAQSIAFSLTIFFLLILCSLPGGWFWLREATPWEQKHT